MWSFHPNMWVRLRLLRPDLLKSILHVKTTPAATPLIKDAFNLLALFCRPNQNRSSVLHDLRNLDDCYVNLEYILYKVITAKYSG